MSAKVMGGDAVPMSSVAMAAEVKNTEVISAECECCGMTEECTPTYVASVRERHGGRWVCGLCGEAVKDEMCRAGRRITTEEALSRHMSFSERFRSSPSAAPADTWEHLIAAMRQLLRRGLDSARAARTTPNSPSRSGAEGGSTGARRGLVRSESCLPALTQ